MKLIYRGGSTLTFGVGSGRQTVKRGEPFDVDDDLAAILLRTDPDVGIAEETADGRASSDVPRETPLAEKTKAELLAIAAELGLELPQRSTNAAIVAAIEAEQTRLAEEAADGRASSDGEGTAGGDATPGDDPEASATGEPGTPPETGPVTLGDLPESARIARG